MTRPMPVDRLAVAARHSPRLDQRSDGVLSVGNGSFAVSVDRTGTQTLPTVTGRGEGPDHRMNTLADWGWHSTPRPEGVSAEEHVRLYASPRGTIPMMDLDGPSEAGADEGSARWLRANPHKVSLLRFHLVDAEGRDLRAQDITAARQHLDLASGVLTSAFEHRGRECTVRTAVDPHEDVLAVSVSDPQLAIALSFPGGSEEWDRAARWDVPEQHTTRVEGARVHRALDALEYAVDVTGARPRQTAAHRVLLQTQGGSDVALDLRLVSSPWQDITGAAAPDRPELTGAAVRERSERFWREHWESTGAIDLSASDDPRAAEMERRVVLSRHLQRIHAAGRMPPAETGLIMNSWRGRAHLEMHWWHAAHFPLFGDAASLRRGLGFYTHALDAARRTAAAQRCRGARWPKQIGPDLQESPSDIGPFLLWQQPHPIHLAELLVRADPAAGRDEQLQRIVEESALFLADVLRRDADGLGLGPPLIGAQERHVAERSALHDPSFELAYVAWALRIADAWRRRRGARDAGELTALAEQVHAPLDRQGRLRTFRRGPDMSRSDHPAHLLAAGMIPPSPPLTEPVVREALHDALEAWDWESTWGWDCPAAAMTAARLGEDELAADLLLRETPKNRVDGAGHCYQRPTLPLYLPAAGSTLVAAALMAAGWDGGPEQPGLPARWGARVEGVLPLPG